MTHLVKILATKIYFSRREGAYDMQHDSIDRIVDEWRLELPTLDSSPLTVIGRVTRLADILRRQVDEALKPYGIGWDLLDVLGALRRAGPPFRRTPTALYRACMLSSGAMTNRIDRLERAGLVTRMPDPQDRRGILVGLTEAGREVVEKAIAAGWTTQHRLMAALTPSDRKRVAGLLRKLLLALEDPEPADDTPTQSESHS
jgi:DNA-binding MarR family transcriptional regulator